jgi:hypothetical protein
MGQHFLFLGNVAAHLVALMSGIASFLLAAVQAIRKKPIWENVFWIAGGLCLFVAFDQAWQDEHRNTQTVIAEKATFAASYGSCSSDLKIASAQTQFFEKQANMGMTNFNTQQETLNSCVVSLGRSNAPEPIKITVKEAAFSVKGQSAHVGNGSPSALVLETNQIITPVHGTLTCNRPFSLLDAEFAMGPHWTLSASKTVIAPNKARLEIETPAWNPGTPLVFLVFSAGDLSPCDFKLD